MSLVILLLLPFLGSLITAVLPTRARTVLASWAGLVSTIAAVGFVALFPEVRDGGDLERVPDSLIVVGGGYVGLELSQATRRLGSLRASRNHGADRLKEVWKFSIHRLDG
jgi:hypothetical protein